MQSVQAMQSQGTVATRQGPLGRIVQVIVHRGQVLAYLLEGHRAVLFEAVSHHQGTVAFIESADDLVPLQKLPRLRHLVGVLGAVGTLESVVFDELTGQIKLAGD